MWRAVPLGQTLQVIIYGVVPLHQLPTLHHGTHQIGLGDTDAGMVHIHHQAIDGLLIELHPIVHPQGTKLIVLREAVEPHIVMFAYILLHANK